MAKQTAAQIDKTQEDVPTQFREAIRISDDGSVAFVTFAIPRKFPVAIRKSDTIEIDVAKIAGASRLLAVWQYGIGRKMRDGALTRMSEKDSEGNVTERQLTESEKHDHAIAHAEMRREWLYGEREQQTRGGVDAETQECRRAIVSYMTSTLGYTAKSVPSTVARALSVTDLSQAAKSEGMAEKAVNALIKRGRAVAALRDEEIEIDLD